MDMHLRYIAGNFLGLVIFMALYQLTLHRSVLIGRFPCILRLHWLFNRAKKHGVISFKICSGIYKLHTELREKVLVHGFEKFLPGPASLLLSKTYEDFFSALYIFRFIISASATNVPTK